MYREILPTIQNVNAWPLAGLILFFVFFIIVVVRVARADKKLIEKMRNMPFDDDTKKDLTVNTKPEA